MTPEQALRIGGHAAQAVLAAKDGNVTDAARHAIDAALEALPADEVRQLVDAAAIRRANVAADALEIAKFGP